MNNYHITCYNSHNKLVYKIDVITDKEKLVKQLKKGYVKFQEFQGEELKTTICYLQQYNKVIIDGLGILELD